MLRIDVVTAGEGALKMNAAIRSIVWVATFNGLEILGNEGKI
jgi:6-phosphofructokinase